MKTIKGMIVITILLWQSSALAIEPTRWSSPSPSNVARAENTPTTMKEAETKSLTLGDFWDGLTSPFKGLFGGEKAEQK